MITVNYLAAATLMCLGLYTVLSRRNLIKIVMGLSLMESSTYLLLVSLAYRRGSTAPVILDPPNGVTMQQLASGNVADPVLQNFCLTAIVIGVAAAAVFLAVVVRLAQHRRSLDSDTDRELRG
ncbi:MAG: Na+/H+ antiporter subunit C [Actinobacteria bacterium 69-20]|jgi:multicomponent Na+:H+ antiporter subunit C|nr:NADH-quinone oxidoreductase subunit K [Actinomycetota bacterium]OJV28753.1 MAG: Na+/H+ antiporter subunit C [Actinobacteria bacterium 69-20]